MSSAEPPPERPVDPVVADDDVWTAPAVDDAPRYDELPSIVGALRGRREVRWGLGVVALLVIGIVFARGAASEVRYETGPGSRRGVDKGIAGLLDGSLGGTECGNWPGELSPSEPPEVPSLQTAVWANVGSFHIRSSHLFVQSVRIDVEGGTASAGGDAVPSLTVPFKPGETLDFKVACRASAMTIHLVGGDGRDVGDAPLSIGAGRSQLAPVRITRDGTGSGPVVCTNLLIAQKSFTEAIAKQDPVGAARKLLDQARITRDSVSSELTEEEQAAATLLIATLEERLRAMEAGDPNAVGPLTEEQQAAGTKIAEAFKRVCR